MNIIENDINKFSDISFGSKSLFSKYSGVYPYYRKFRHFI